MAKFGPICQIVSLPRKCGPHLLPEVLRGGEVVDAADVLVQGDAAGTAHAPEDEGAPHNAARETSSGSLPNPSTCAHSEIILSPLYKSGSALSCLSCKVRIAFQCAKSHIKSIDH